MIAKPPLVNIGASDRLSLTLFLALVVHSIIILGVSFTLPDPAARNPLPTIELTLVHHRSDKEPEKADFLAQSNQMGGGNSTEKVRPRSPASRPILTPNPGTAQMSLPASQARQQPLSNAVITVARSEQKINQTPSENVNRTKKTPTAVQLMSRSQQMASLSAEFDDETEMRAQQPRQKFISAQTRESKYVAYMEAWRAKVERVGNINYPDEAKRKGLSGSIILDAVINQDGTIHELVLRRSSGHRTLDQAAMRIVRLAGPYSPLPEAIRKDTDQLHIIRTWEFRSTNRLFAR